MSTPKKLSRPDSEVTKLKLLWRDSLSEEAKSFWQELFVSPSTQAEIRAEIFKKLKVNLRRDNQLNAFRDWELEQRQRDLEAERQMEDEKRIQAEHPNWNLDQAREAVLKKSYERTLATGDFVLGLKTVRQDLNAKIVTLDRQKFEFDAAKLALASVQKLKTISASKLTDVEKIDAARRALFGELPEKA